MRIKKYAASTMKEALLQIKQDLGEDAMILKTRKLPGKIFSLGEQNRVEVTAAIDESGAGATATAPPLNLSSRGTYTRKGKTGPAKPPPEAPKAVPFPPRGRDDSMAERFQFLELREDIRELKGLLESILSTGESSAAGGFAGAWAILYKRLIDSEISEQAARELIGEVKGAADSPGRDIDRKFLSVLSRSFPVSGPIKEKDDGPSIAAFVGPTGAGKTTTIAKLAAHYSLNKGKVASIITADTYRIAAIEQIRAFADIVDIGLQVVFAPEEIADALVACENDDIVFVDTAGRSQRNAEHMRELDAFLDRLRPDETHLVLNATTKDSDLGDIVKRYDGYGISRLLFTKLDETARLGNIFNTVRRSGIPVSYFTTGQSVPDDIELAQPGRFVQRLWEGSGL